MKELNVNLTHIDRIILESYRSFAEGLSHYLGDDYEIVLHSLEDCNHSVIKIFNGYHTGRTEGAPITDLALSMLNKINEMGDQCKDITYFCKNKKGEPLKSSTITITGENQRIIGLMCINFYMNTPFYNFINNFTEQNFNIMDSTDHSETFVDNVEDLIGQAVTEIRKNVFADTDIPANCKNKEIVAQLYEKGIFNLKDAVVITADILNVSRNTVYMHIRNYTEQNAV